MCILEVLIVCPLRTLVLFHEWDGKADALLFYFASLQTFSHSFYNLLSTCCVSGPMLGSVREHRSDYGRNGLCSVPLMVKAEERTKQPRWLPPGIDAMESMNQPKQGSGTWAPGEELAQEGFWDKELSAETWKRRWGPSAP